MLYTVESTYPRGNVCMCHRVSIAHQVAQNDSNLSFESIQGVTKFQLDPNFRPLLYQPG